MSEMKDMLSNMQRMFEESERKREEERAAEAAKPSKCSLNTIDKMLNNLSRHRVYR